MILQKAKCEITVGLIGSGIDKSCTPNMHRREAEALGLEFDYRLINIDHLPPSDRNLEYLLDMIEEAGFRGVNVTHPYKQQALECVDHLSHEAQEISAINTIIFEDGTRVGHNTDCWGFSQSFQNSMQNAPRRTVILLGAGGAGASVAKALLDIGTEKLLVFDTEHTKAESLVKQISRFSRNACITVLTDITSALSNADGLVNATPVGMPAYPGSPVPPHLITKAHWIADVVYIPLETELLRHARAAGCQTLSGAGMAIQQAVRAFELFTDHKADSGRMTRTFEQGLSMRG